MVEGMSIVVNVMLSLMSVMSPPPDLCNLSVRTVVKLCSFGFRCEFGFLNCDDVCMCVVNTQFELLELVFDSVYVDLQYDEISLTFTAESVSLCCVCGRLWSVCEVVVVPYVDKVVAVSVMRVLLFVACVFAERV